MNEFKLAKNDLNHSPAFDPLIFLSETGPGRTALHVPPKRVFFSQGDPADAIFYLQTGTAKLTVASAVGKEATIIVLSPGDFIGEECLASVPGMRTASASAVTECSLLRLDRAEMMRVLQEESAFSELFLRNLLLRIARSEAHVVNLLLDTSEKRLAKTLLAMAEFGREVPAGVLIPKITQDALADMVGTTRSRVSHFMNRFRDDGHITYDRRIWVRRSLLNVLRVESDEDAEAPRSSGGSRWQ